MDYSQVMALLAAQGDAETLAFQRSQGATGALHGVPMSLLLTIARGLGTNDALARQLWASGVVDARFLAVMIAEPDSLSLEDLDAWAHDVSYYPLIDQLIHLVVSTPHASALVDRWVTSDREFVARCGFLTMAEMAKLEREVGDRELESKLSTIEEHIRSSTTRAKEELGAALVTIGRRNDRLNDLALEVARRLGKIQVEHPELGLIESDAVELLRNPDLAAKVIAAVRGDGSGGPEGGGSA